MARRLRSASENTESARIVFVVEVSDAFFSKSKSVNALRREIECEVLKTYGEFPRRRFEVLLTYPRSTPRTTSGKVRRYAVRRKYIEKGIEAIAEEDDADENGENDETDEIDKVVLEIVRQESVDGKGARTLRTPLPRGNVRSIYKNWNRNHETVRNNFGHLSSALVYERARHICTRKASIRRRL